MELEIPDNKLFSTCIEKEPYDNKPRKRAYREILSGLRYHKGELLSFVTIGFKRGTVVDIRTFLKKLTTFIKRCFDKRIDYYRVTVWDNNSSDSSWRVHIHMIWNAPYIKQRLLVEKVEAYIGETGSVYIKLLDGDDKKTARYLMQYLGNQDGRVQYNKSRGWLPDNYTREWKALKSEFYEKTPRESWRMIVSNEEFIHRASKDDETWKKAVLIDGMNAWIDEQRRKKEHCEGKRMENNSKFEIVERTKDECRHDTGVIHSLGLKCEDVEHMVTAYGIHEDDPDHQRLWHNEKLNPYLTILQG